MRYGENALNVIDGIKKKIEEIKSSLPEGVRIVPTYDRSDLIKRAIATLREKLIEESIVVALVCIVFLWHIRSSLVAIITLPIAIILSFIPMWWMNVTSNIMSLGGIAIAIGAMVDSAIIMIENAHKSLENFRDEYKREPNNVERAKVIIAAAKSVGRSLFFALLVITVSFIPVFTLTAQEGRLFKPLAFTKTFSMFFASFLGVTLVPVLMLLLIRGKIAPEIKNPVNRFLIATYQPFVNFALRYRAFTLVAALVILLLTIFPFSRLGSEFMPPLNEGTLLYMPTAVPGISITEGTKILQIQDRQLKKIPEAVTVFGKAGQAETPTDPAPLSMFETVITLKPPNEWRKGMTWDKLLAEVNANITTPGMANIFWMPIQTRTEMLTTGFRSVLGVKVFGPDLGGIQKIAVQIEKELANFPNTRSAFAERTVGGYFLDFTVNREAAARYGLKVGDVNDIIETAKTSPPPWKVASAIRSTRATRAIFARTSTRLNACSFPHRPARKSPSHCSLILNIKPVRHQCAAKTENWSGLFSSISRRATSTGTCARRRNNSANASNIRPVTTLSGRGSFNISKRRGND